MTKISPFEKGISLLSLFIIIYILGSNVSQPYRLVKIRFHRLTYRFYNTCQNSKKEKTYHEWMTTIMKLRSCKLFLFKVNVNI
jgi:hypothetical protein